MTSHHDIPDGSPVGADPGKTSPVIQRSSSFGSPGADPTVRRIDLNDALIRHPQATFTFRARGQSMRGAGIGDGDVLLVDRAVKPAVGLVVIAVVEGELVCRKLERREGVLVLATTDSPGEVHVPSEGDTVEVWGVVTTVIKSLLG